MRIDEEAGVGAAKLKKRDLSHRSALKRKEPSEQRRNGILTLSKSSSGQYKGKFLTAF